MVMHQPRRFLRRPTRRAARPVLITLLLLSAGCHETAFEVAESTHGSFSASRIPPIDQRDPPVSPVLDDKSFSPKGASSGRPTTPAAAVADELNRGHREAAMNHQREAETCYRRVLSQDSENAVAHHRLAVLADARRDFGSAESHYRAALAQNADDPAVLGDLGFSYMLQGRLAESERCLLRATRLDPSHPAALHNLGLLYAEMGDHDRSFDALQRAMGERAARDEIARLFPGGPPPSSREGAFIASFAPSTGVRGVSARPNNGDASIAAQSSAGAEQHDSLAVAARRDRASTSRGPAGKPVPDDQIGETLAAIDREGSSESQTLYVGPEPTSPALALSDRAATGEPADQEDAVSTADFRRASAGLDRARYAAMTADLDRQPVASGSKGRPSASTALPERDVVRSELRAPSDVEPLESMPVWQPPKSAQRRTSRAPAPARRTPIRGPFTATERTPAESETGALDAPDGEAERLVRRPDASGLKRAQTALGLSTIPDDFAAGPTREATFRPGRTFSNARAARELPARDNEGARSTGAGDTGVRDAVVRDTGEIGDAGDDAPRTRSLALQSAPQRAASRRPPAPRTAEEDFDPSSPAVPDWPGMTASRTDRDAGDSQPTN